MFVNKDMRKSARAIASLDPEVLSLKEIPNTLKTHGATLATHANTVDIDLLPGGGRLFRCQAED
jgi:hypothetical protein